MTLARTLGATTHFSLLWRRLVRLGLGDARRLRAVAVQRGCRHYDEGGAPVIDPGTDEISNVELAMALLLGRLPYEPVNLRVAAQLLGDVSAEARQVAKLARMERCEEPVIHIAQQGVQRDLPRASFWSELLTRLPQPTGKRAGVFPHGSRFVAQTGISNPFARERRPAGWLRPTRVA